MHPPNRRRPQHPVNRRRPRPSQTRVAAQRHGQRLHDQLRRLGAGLGTGFTRLGSWICALPRTIHDTLAGQPPPRDSAQDSAVFGEPRTWDRQRGADSGTHPATPADRTWEHRRASTPDRTFVASDHPDDESTDRTLITRRQPELETPAEPTPGIATQAAALGRRLIPHATEFGRQIAPRAAQLGRQLGPLARRGATMTGRGMRAAGRGIIRLRPLLALFRRFLAALGELTMRLGDGLAFALAALRRGLVTLAVRHQALLFGLFTRVLWWSALVLLLLGGQALVEIHGRAPLDQRAFPAFALGLGLCALLVTIAAQARLRWAALVLGFSHGGLLALVWVVAAAIH